MGYISNLLAVSKLNNGKIRCESCNRKFRFSDLNALQLQPCPKCKCPNFIPRRIKDYWLIKPLGAGGFGAVYQGISATNYRDVAIKLLNCESNESDKFIKSLQNEYDVGMALKGNPHLVTPIEFGLVKEEVFLVSEFITGLRLDVILNNMDCIPEAVAYQLILQILEIEEYIYDCGYLYRDLKPENIMIDKKGNIKLLDYGLCLTVQQAETNNMLHDTIEGSPYYLPPERVAGLREDQYSEIYSMGMLFYNMLAGHTFFKSSSGVKNLLVKHIKTTRIKNIKSSLCNCKTITGIIINRMINKRPEERFNSYEVLAKVLKNGFRKVRQESKNSISFNQFLKSTGL